jgi:hypothetical protein
LNLAQAEACATEGAEEKLLESLADELVAMDCLAHVPG